MSGMTISSSTPLFLRVEKVDIRLSSFTLLHLGHFGLFSTLTEAEKKLNIV